MPENQAQAGLCGISQLDLGSDAFQNIQAGGVRALFVGNQRAA
jgi:hypothetical protein